jgi:hypothetical protein
MKEDKLTSVKVIDELYRKILDYDNLEESGSKY